MNMQSIARRYKPFIKKNFLISAVGTLIFLGISIWIQHIAGLYATRSASNSVTDVILSNIRVYDVDWFFVYGAIVMWIVIAVMTLYEPKRFLFIYRSVILFILVRSVFITLTHIGPFPTQVAVESELMKIFTLGGDLFFSGHTGLPFLMALIFWDHKSWRYFFIILSLIFGAVVLMAHLHYSIDVLGAFFITHSIFHASERIFKKDRAMFHGQLLPF